MSSLLDARGCLTEQGLAAVAAAAVGQAPADAAAHLARCARCQDRLLARGREASGPRKTAPAQPFRNLVLVGGVLLLILLMLGITLVVLGGR